MGRVDVDERGTNDVVGRTGVVVGRTGVVDGRTAVEEGVAVVSAVISPIFPECLYK